MTNPKALHQQQFIAALQDYASRMNPEEQLNLEGEGTDCLAAWFLGPKAENKKLLKSLIMEAIADQADYRKAFHPEDPKHITSKVKASSSYKKAVKTFKEEYQKLLAQLRQSVPFFSMRYQGHMLWDTTLPGTVGYFAAMLYNQNNVAAEASPVTTLLEIQVGIDLCRMLGYEIPQEGNQNAIAPWGHITCDGSVANTESLWAARNLKFYPLALKEALLHSPKLAKAQQLEVTLLNGQSQKLIELDTWTLLNLKADEVLTLPQTMQTQYGIPLETTTQVLTAYSIQNLGFDNFHRQFLQDLKHSPVGMVPATKHYSWPKAAALLGIGANNMLNIPVDLDARMEMGHLRQTLQKCLDEQRPVITVVAVMGSTEESAVDPLKDIYEMREEFRAKGLEYTIHADAAWGGYFASMLREDDEAESLNEGKTRFTPELPMSPYVAEQIASLPKADSITVDPHKSGYIPYPAGGLCYRNSAMRNLVAFTAPVIYHPGSDQPDVTVGIYGVEGSKPGAAAAAVYLSHRVIRPTKSGYGKILGDCLFTSKKLYARLVTMRDERFTITLFNRLPAEKAGESTQQIQAQLDFIRDRIVGKTNKELLHDPEAMALFQQLGADQLILPYTFNFKDREGKLNTDVKKLNALNQKIFEILSVKPGEEVNQKNLIVTSSEFDPASYGNVFMNAFRQRLGVKGSEDTAILFLISTVMDPWLTETSSGSFLEEIESALREAVYTALDQLGY